jgi:hypothetical protein
MLVRLLGSAREVGAHERAVLEVDELLDRAAHEVGDLAAEDLRYLVVGVDEMPGLRDGDPLESGGGQAPESFLALVQRLVRAVPFDGAPKTAAAALSASTSEGAQLRSRRVSPKPRAPQ